MKTPLYQNCQPHRDRANGHMGLWFERFFNGYTDDWNGVADTAKVNWLNMASGQVGERQLIERTCERQQRLCRMLNGNTRIYCNDWHFATGLGNPHPVENGFLWHPTLGIPYLSGSSVKGLVRSWIEAWESFDDEVQRVACLKRWFGSDHKDPQNQESPLEAGAFIFFDALPIKPVTLKTDVMTPHMGKWYEKGSDISDPPNQTDREPGDWHDPVPVPFLVAEQIALQFAIAPRISDACAELDAVWTALDNALSFLGAGAKTAVGYGFMTQPEETRPNR